MTDHIEQATAQADFVDEFVEVDIEYGSEDGEETINELDFN